eukprot:3219296-Prymnesium_polylepis.1
MCIRDRHQSPAEHRVGSRPVDNSVKRIILPAAASPRLAATALAVALTIRHRPCRPFLPFHLSF